MKYIQAMISTPAIDGNDLDYSPDDVTERMKELRDSIAPNPEAGEPPANPSLEMKALIEPLNQVDLSFSELLGQLEEHSCITDDVPNLIPVGGSGTTEPLNVQMERAGFLNGEVVVILRESDFRHLTERSEHLNHLRDGSCPLPGCGLVEV